MEKIAKSRREQLHILDKGGRVRKRIIVCISFFFLMFVIVSTSSATPIIQDLENGSNSIWLAEIVGQSFTAEDAYIDWIGIGVEDVNTSINDLTIEMAIFAGDGIFSTELKREEFTLDSGFAGYVDMDATDLILEIGETQVTTVHLQDAGSSWNFSLPTLSLP